MPIRGALFLIAAAAVLAACGGEEKNSIPDEGVVDFEYQSLESAASLAASTAFATEMASYDTPSTVTTCSLYQHRRANCDGSIFQTQLNWKGCSIGSTRLSGIWKETWSDANDCRYAFLSNGHHVTRVTEGTGSRLVFSDRSTIRTTTAAHKTWDDVSIPATGLKVTMSAGSRTVTIDGIRRLMIGPGGRLWFDHSIKTLAPLTVTGNKATANLLIGGSMRVHHNLAKYNSELTLNNLSWTIAQCCHPTSGSISALVSGSISGNSTLTFSAPCGTASFTARDGSTTPVVLKQCD